MPLNTAEVPVAWSRDAVATLPGGGTFNAFQSYSYVANVKLPGNPRTVVVLLPPGAAAKPEREWHHKVVKFALTLVAMQSYSGVMQEDDD